jgi:hypothetical protein
MGSSSLWMIQPVERQRHFVHNYSVTLAAKSVSSKVTMIHCHVSRSIGSERVFEHQQPRHLLVDGDRDDRAARRCQLSCLGRNHRRDGHALQPAILKYPAA